MQCKLEWCVKDFNVLIYSHEGLHILGQNFIPVKYSCQVSIDDNEISFGVWKISTSWFTLMRAAHIGPEFHLCNVLLSGFHWWQRDKSYSIQKCHPIPWLRPHNWTYQFHLYKHQPSARLVTATPSPVHQLSAVRTDFHLLSWLCSTGPVWISHNVSPTSVELYGGEV